MSKTRMGKRVASLLLSLVMMLSLLPTTVYAEGADTGDTTDEIVGQATTSGDNTEGTGKPEPTGEGEDGSANVTEGEDGAATNDAVVEETIAPVNAEGVDAVANAESSGDEVSGEDGNEATSFVTVNGVGYATLEAAIAAAEPVNGVITYTINGKVEVTDTGWVQVAKAGLTGLTKVAFVGATDDAAIYVTKEDAVLADQVYGNVDVSFSGLTLVKENPAYLNDYAEFTQYFAMEIRATVKTGVVTYTDCKFPEGVINNTYGKTVFTGCKFSNDDSRYNLWVKEGEVELNNGAFTGRRGVKLYNTGNAKATITVKDTTFEGLTEKAAIVVSQPAPADVTLENVTARNCTVGLIQKDTATDATIIKANGESISGTFNITNAGAAKDEFNISAGTFTSEVPNDYCADGFEVKANADGTTYGVEKAASYVAKIGEAGFATLADAIAAAEVGQTVTLLADATEDVTINKNITLDLGGKTLTNTNAGKATISVTGGTVTVKNGTVIGGTSYYNIEVTKGSNANLTLEGVTATAGNDGSSMIDNWGTLTIESGDYKGGLNVVKSEEGSKLTITGGEFTLNYAPSSGYTAVILVYGDTTITGGEFTQTATPKWGNPQVVMTGVVEGYTAITRITGGTFTNKKSGDNIFHGLGKATSDNFEVSGGTFNKSISDGYCADGFIPTKNADGTYGVKEGKYVARIGSKYYETLADAIRLATKGKTITLLADVTENVTIKDIKNLTLDLNGFTLNGGTGTAKAALTNYGTITIKDSSADKAGTIKRDDKGITGETSYYVIDNHGTMTIEGGNVINNSGYRQTSSIGSMNGSSLIRNGGTDAGATLTITGGTLEQTNFIAIKNDALGKLRVTGGKITSNHSAIQNWYEATITGGEITGQLWTDAYMVGESVGVTTIGGDAKFTGEIVMDITGSVVPTLAINGGNLKVTNWRITSAAAKAGAKPAISGGTFTSAVPENYCANGYIPTANADGSTYGVKGPFVAKIGSEGYATLQAAIDAATRNQTVTMLANTEENVTIAKALTLDLNGFTLNGGTVAGKPALTVKARVTVKDSSEAQTGTIMREDTAENSGVSSHYVIDIQGRGVVMTFESGNVKNNSGNADRSKGASLVRVGDDSITDKKANPTLTINGGTFTQDNFIVIKVDRGYLNLNGGTLNSANTYAVENWFRATIKGGTVNGAVSSWTYSAGSNSTLTIEDGTVNGTVTSVNYGSAADKQARVYITGGTVNGELDTRSYDPKTGKLTSIDDAAKATIKVSGGTFNNAVEARYCDEGYTPVQISDGKYGVQQQQQVLAKIGDTAYYTMDEAFHAVQANETIVMQRDYTTGAEQYSGNKSFTIDLNGKTWTYTGTNTNHAAFEINHSDVTLTVKNGTVVSNSMVGLIPSAIGVDGPIAYDNAGLVFDGVTMTANGHSGIETNGSNTNDSVKLVNSTLNVPNGFGIYFPSSGTLTIDNSTINAKTMGVQVCSGSLSINAGSAITVSGDAVSKTENDGAIQDGAAISIVNRAGYKGLGDVTVTGGTFTAKPGNAAIKAYDWDNTNNVEKTFTANDKVFVSGGTFSSAVPEGLCKDGYISVANADGTHTVKEGVYVAKVDNVKYETLADAIGAAQDGDTVTLLKDIDLPATAVVKGKTITLDLNGKTISNSTDIWNESINAWSLISVRVNGDLTINDTAGGGTLKAKENDCYALDVQDKDTALTVNAGTYVGNISAIYAYDGKVTINGGHFSIQQKKDDGDPYRFTLNCYDSNYKADSAGFTVNGGTFTNFDPRNNKAEGAGTSFVAEGVGVNYENGTFTAKPNMAAQIVDAGGGSVAAYAGHYDAIAAAKDGETVILLSDRKNFVTNTINANITIDLNGKTLSVGNNNPFFRTNGEVTIQNGTIESNSACAIVNAYNKLTLKNVKITGVTGDSGKNLVNVCSNAEVTIDKDTVLTASGSGVAVFIGQDADAQYTLNVYGKVIQQKKSYAISGNGSYEGATTINIYEGAEVRSASVAIYHPQAGEINVYGGLVEGYCGIGIKSGTLNITGGQVLGVGDDDELSDENSNPNGMTYDGSAIIIDSRAVYAGNVKINISGDALVQSSYSTAIREIGESAETTNVTALNVTGGKVLGASGKAAIQLHGVTADVTSISGGEFSSIVKKEYCAPGFTPVTTANSEGRYGVEIGKFTVQVTSRTVSSASPVANVSGGGSNITYAGGTTVTAASLSGYKFVGWFVNEYVEGNEPVSKELSFKFQPTDHCKLIAVYEPISGAKFYLTVNASEFTVGESAVYDSYMHDQVAAGESVTVTFKGTENFLYWVNASRKVVSTNPAYTFIMGSETTLSAVYGKTREAQATVVFMSDSDQIITSKAYKSGTAIQFPTPPIKMGCTFEAWSMTEKEIQDAIAASNNGVIVVKACYTDPSTPYTVTVLYPDDTKEEYSGMVGKTVTLTAKKISGKTFSYWRDSKNNVLGYTTTLMLAPSGNITVTAVYGDTAEVKPVITMTAVEAGKAETSYYVISFTATRAVPEGYTVVKQGILYSVDSQCTGEGAKDYMKLTDEGSVPAGIYEFEGNNTELSGVTLLHAKVGAVDRTIYGRGYMVLKNSSGTMEYVYSDNILSGSYSGLTKIGG